MPGSPLPVAELFERHADSGWWSFTPANGVWQASQRTRALLGLDDDQGPLEWFLAQVHADDRDSCREHFAASRAGRFTEFNSLVRPLASSLRWLLLRAWKVDDGTDRWFGTATDATDRMVDREHVRLKEGFWRELVNVMPVVISVINLRGEHLDLLGDLEGVVGWKLTDLIGNRDFQFIWPEDRHLAAQVFIDMNAGLCRQRDLEFRVIHRSGAPVWVECRAYLLDGFGPEPVIVGYHYPIDDRYREREGLERAVAARTAELHTLVASLEREVAERTRVAELLRQREEQLIRGATRQALGTLVAGVVHELGSPLATAEMGVELLRRSSPQAAASETIERVHNALRHATEVVMALREGTPDRPRVTFAGVDLADIAATALGLAEHARRRQGVVIERDLPQGIAQLFASSRRLSQVVLNLVLNALQSLPSSGGTVKVRVFVQDDHAWCTVIDNGVGMPGEVIRRLGEPFFTTRQQEGGQGLGLSVSFGIAQEHGGRIAFVSTPGLGTTASLILPLSGQAKP